MLIFSVLKAFYKIVMAVTLCSYYKSFFQVYTPTSKNICKSALKREVQANDILTSTYIFKTSHQKQKLPVPSRQPVVCQ